MVFISLNDNTARVYINDQTTAIRAINYLTLTQLHQSPRNNGSEDEANDSPHPSMPELISDSSSGPTGAAAVALAMQHGNPSSTSTDDENEGHYVDSTSSPTDDAPLENTGEHEELHGDF